MKICAVSDLHGNLDGFDPCDADIVVIAGDLAPMKGWGVWHVNDQVKWINRKFSAWCGQFPDTEFVVIPGNHDLFAQRDDVPTKVVCPGNVHFVVDRVVDVKGIRIAGSPWIPPISGRWAFETRDEADLARHFAWIPEGMDILITHTPPFVEDWDVSAYCLRRCGFESRMTRLWAMMIFVAANSCHVLNLGLVVLCRTWKECFSEAGDYNSPAMLVAGAMIFVVFLKTQFPDWLQKLCGHLAPSMFSVYLLHTAVSPVCKVIRDRSILFFDAGFDYPCHRVVSVVAVSMIIFSGCVAIDVLRRISVNFFRRLWR